MLPVPANLPARFEPVIRLLESTLITPKELAQHWGQHENTLANMRSGGKGLPYIALPGGGSIRYRVSEVLAAELAGTRGPLSVERVALELAAMPDVPVELQHKIIERLRTSVAGTG